MEISECADKKFTEQSIVADVGGTNCRVAVYGKWKQGYEQIFLRVYDSDHITRFYIPVNEVLKEVHERYGLSVAKGCFAIAGPISSNGRVSCLTNNTWQVDVDELYVHTLLKEIKLLNDFEAIGFGIPSLDISDDAHVVPLHHHDAAIVHPQHGGVKSVLGAGTGLGCGMLISGVGGYRPYPSEGGHTDIVSYDEQDWRFVQYLRGHILPHDQHPDYERILSGTGIAYVYEFLRSEGYGEGEEVALQIDRLHISKRPMMISTHVSNSHVCKKTMEFFARHYAHRLRHLALTTLPYGGLYIAGGIAAKNLTLFKEPSFMDTFVHTDKMSDLLLRIPVYVVTDEEVGLKGCARAVIG
ncbi:glucokinase [Candidatus Woesearchaeota archaeon]|nr:glucokinase [Candidatus Woesearchaeota archaeon]